jgi:hypothetical protein
MKFNNMNVCVKNVINISTFFIIIILLFIYFWKWIDPALIDFKQQPFFLFDSKFLMDYLVFPGGLAEYLSLFISQFFHFSLPGALILILIFSLVIILTRKLLSRFLPMDYILILQYIPVLLLVYLHSQYTYTLKPDIIIIISVLLTLLYNYYINKGNLFRIALFVLCSGLLVFLLGGVSLILFSLLVILSEIRNKKDKYILMVMVFLIISFILPFLIGLYNPYMNIDKAFFDIFIPQKDYMPGVTLYALLLFYPLIALSGIILSGITSGYNLTGNKHRGRKLITIVIQTAIPVILLLLTLKYSYNKNNKALIELNYYAEKENWEAVLNAGKILSPENRVVLAQLNRALYHKGRLTEDLFSYKQLWGENGLILTRYYNSKILMPISDYYFDLGYIKESSHWAYEALTKYEMAPIVLKRIALSNLILGEYKIAGKFLTILSKSIIHRKWTNKYLKYLNNDDLVKSDPVIREKRELMPKHDYYAINDQPEKNLYNLLEENPKNNMAFEYLMASYLLRHDIGNVIKNLHYLTELNYTKIPRHIEEAILVYIVFQTGVKIQLEPYKISNITVQRFNRYNNILYKGHKNDLKAAQKDLALNFGDTFWYYLHYLSPITTKREIKERSLE